MYAQKWLDNLASDLHRSPPASMPLIVGITGSAGAGKDTLAGWLERHHNYNVLRFADPIKRGVEAMFGLSPSVWEDRDAKERTIEWLGFSPRRLAQLLGTEFGRNTLYEHVWIDVLRQRLSKLPDRRIVIPDVRFDNEASMLTAMGAVIIRVERRGTTPVELHVSEDGVSPEYVDFYLPNNGTIREMCESAVGYLAERD